jgi:hypothetical protein
MIFGNIDWPLSPIGLGIFVRVVVYEEGDYRDRILTISLVEGRLAVNVFAELRFGMVF